MMANCHRAMSVGSTDGSPQAWSNEVVVRPDHARKKSAPATTAAGPVRAGPWSSEAGSSEPGPQKPGPQKPSRAAGSDQGEKHPQYEPHERQGSTSTGEAPGVTRGRGPRPPGGAGWAAAGSG